MGDDFAGPQFRSALASALDDFETAVKKKAFAPQRDTSLTGRRLTDDRLAIRPLPSQCAEGAFMIDQRRSHGAFHACHGSHCNDVVTGNDQLGDAAGQPGKRVFDSRQPLDDLPARFVEFSCSAARWRQIWQRYPLVRFEGRSLRIALNA